MWDFEVVSEKFKAAGTMYKNLSLIPHVFIKSSYWPGIYFMYFKLNRRHHFFPEFLVTMEMYTDFWRNIADRHAETLESLKHEIRPICTSLYRIYNDINFCVRPHHSSGG
jgi:hypothetical protein